MHGCESQNDPGPAEEDESLDVNESVEVPEASEVDDKLIEEFGPDDAPWVADPHPVSPTATLRSTAAAHAPLGRRGPHLMRLMLCARLAARKPAVCPSKAAELPLVRGVQPAQRPTPKTPVTEQRPRPRYSARAAFTACRIPGNAEGPRRRF
jgi:hypothetical protein